MEEWDACVAATGEEFASHEDECTEVILSKIVRERFEQF
jgi:hypothetical protein